MVKRKKWSGKQYRAERETELSGVLISDASDEIRRSENGVETEQSGVERSANGVLQSTTTSNENHNYDYDDDGDEDDDDEK